MRVKLAQAGEGWGLYVHPPFITFTITSKVAVNAPAEWAETLTLFHLNSKSIYSVIQINDIAAAYLTTVSEYYYGASLYVINQQVECKLIHQSFLRAKGEAVSPSVHA
jgi:hypothetical protein